jgi:hypothetical protein
VPSAPVTASSSVTRPSNRSSASTVAPATGSPAAVAMPTVASAARPAVREVDRQLLERVRVVGRGVAVGLHQLRFTAVPHRVDLTELGAAVPLVVGGVGDDDLTEPVLRRALELATRCGAAPLAARRPRRIALRGVESLTPGEGRVAHLARPGPDQPRDRPGRSSSPPGRWRCTSRTPTASSTSAHVRSSPPHSAHRCDDRRSPRDRDPVRLHDEGVDPVCDGATRT